MTDETTEISHPSRPPADAHEVPAADQEANGAERQRAMQVAALIEDQTEVSKRERARAGRAAGGDATPEQKAERSVAAVSPKRSEPAERVRPAAAAKAGISERKVRKAQFVSKAAPALAAEAAHSPSPDHDDAHVHVFTFIERARCPKCDSTALKSYGRHGRKRDGGLYSYCKKCLTKLIHHRVKTRNFQLD